jgi:Predicted membrane protein
MRLTRAIAGHWESFAQAIGDDIRSLGADRLRERRAIATGLAVALAIYAALLLNLDYPMWSGMSALTVLGATVRATTVKGVLRIVGTMAGALLAVLLLVFIAGLGWLVVATLFATVSYSLYRSYVSPYPYAWLLGGITTGLVLMQSMADPTIGLHVAAYRAGEIVVGVVCAFVVGILILPPASDDAHDRALAIAKRIDRRLALRTALEAGFGICVVVWLYDWFDLPGFSGAAISLTRIVDPDPELGRHRGFLRLLGCTVGGGIGLALVGASIDFLPAFLAATFVCCTIFGYVFAGPPASAYAGMQAGFAFIIAYAPTVTPSDTLEPAIDRFAGILLAFAVFWMIDALFAPEPTSEPPASETAASATAKPAGEEAKHSRRSGF